MPACPSCNTAEHVIDDLHNGIIVCTGCGTQIGDQMINEGAEWRTFSEDVSRGDPSRVGGVDNTIRGVGTTIAGNGVLSHRHNQASLTSSQLVMERVMHLCKTYQRRLDLEMQIYHEAERICKLVIEAPIEYRGKTLKQDTLAAVCIHLACRNKAQDRKKSDVIAVAAVNEKAFNKQFQRVTTILHYLARQANAKGMQVVATPRDES
uniref:General transcription factor TFIIB n=1 Tax=Lygus hesperus TaxID=30085 RepID=A0A0A9WNN9_LYGHE